MAAGECPLDPDKLLLSVLIFLGCGAMIGVLVGAGMLFKPGWIVALNRYFYRWLGTEGIEQQLDRPRGSERFFYRHHRLTGGGVLAGAMLVLYALLFGDNLRGLAAALAPDTRWLVDAALAVLLVGSVLAALVGIVVLARPSLLRQPEQWANRWIASDGLLKFFNAMHYSFDRYSLRHRKIAGGLLLIASLYVLMVLGRLLWSGAWQF